MQRCMGCERAGIFRSESLHFVGLAISKAGTYRYATVLAFHSTGLPACACMGDQLVYVFNACTPEYCKNTLKYCEAENW
jgi:hypothetical protein